MSRVYVGIEGKELFVVIEGRGTAEYCMQLSNCVEEILSTTCIQRIRFDTRNTVYLDSSFIGIILSFKKKYQMNKNFVQLLNPSDKVLDIFAIMGLESFIPIECDLNIECKKYIVEIHQKLENSIADIRLLLEAHQNIMSTNDENHRRFALVEKVFQQELHQKKFPNK